MKHFLNKTVLLTVLTISVFFSFTGCNHASNSKPPVPPVDDKVKFTTTDEALTYVYDSKMLFGIQKMEGDKYRLYLQYVSSTVPFGSQDLKLDFKELSATSNPYGTSMASLGFCQSTYENLEKTVIKAEYLPNTDEWTMQYQDKSTPANNDSHKITKKYTSQILNWINTH